MRSLCWFATFLNISIFFPGFSICVISFRDHTTYVAPFVNAEETEYLVIEDAFSNGRPELEKGGLMFTNRETVDKVERMKVCTCLNPLHTCLAIFGCLLGYRKISDEMNDPELKNWWRLSDTPKGFRWSQIRAS